MTIDGPPLDKSLECGSCGDGFVFTSGEQELYRLRGITTEPTQCPNCARGRVLSLVAARSPNGDRATH